MQLSPMSYKLASKVEQIKSDHLDSWIRGMRDSNERFFGVKIHQIGQVKMFAARHLQEIGLFNVVVGLTSQDEHLLPEIIRFYDDCAINRYHIEINPYRVNTTFLQALARNGFVVSAFQTYLYGLSSADSVSFSSANTSVCTVLPSEVNLFADLHLQGFQEALALIPEEATRRYRECLKVLYQLPGWYLFIMRNGKTPSGMSMLYTQDDMALLAGGAMLPGYRGQGGHKASLFHRFQVACEAQCPFIVGQTGVSSQSQQNMQYFGMQTAYSGTNWVRLKSC